MASTAASRLNVSELDFDKIKTNMRNFMTGQAEFAGYDFSGSAFDVLMDIMAYNTHYNAFYANMVANEMFLDSATLRDSVVARAKHLGYLPRSVIGSKAKVTLDITPSGSPATISIGKNTQFQGDVNGVTYIWCTGDSYTVNVNANGVYTIANVALTQGIPITHRYTANTGDPDQEFKLPNANSDIDSLTVVIQTSASDSNTAAYALANDITTVNSTTNCYFISPVDEGAHVIEFGDDTIGRKISNGNIVILTSLIAEANATNGCYTFSVVTDVGGYSNVLVTSESAAAGGAVADTIEQIKFSAPKNYDAQNRCVTAQDYVRIVKRDYSGSDSVVAWGGEDDDPPIYGKVRISIKPSEGNTLSTATKEDIKTTVLGKRNIVGVTPEIVDPDYVYIVIRATVKYDSTLTTNTPATIKSAISTAVDDFGITYLNNFDKAFRHSNLSQKIDEAEISIKSNQTSVQLKRNFYPTIGTTGAYDLKFSNEIYHPANTFWGAIKSDAFSYADTAGTVYTGCKLQDANGVMQVYRTSGADRILVANNIGTVTYGTGKVAVTNFKPAAVGANSSGNTSLLNVVVTPASNDILPLREQILLINTGDVTVTMIDDSGSGTYTTGSTTTSGTTTSTVY